MTQQDIDNKLLAIIQQHFPSLPLDDRYTDWGKWLAFANAVYEASRAAGLQERATVDMEPVAWGMLHAGGKVVDTITEDDRQRDMSQWAWQFPEALVRMSSAQAAIQQAVAQEREKWEQAVYALKSTGDANANSDAKRFAELKTTLCQAREALCYHTEQTRPVFETQKAIAAIDELIK